MVIVLATFAAAGVALAWTLSPLTVVGLVVLTMTGRWVARGTAGTERRWLIGAIVFATTARLIVLLVVFFLTNPAREQFHGLIPDGRYAIVRSLLVLNQWMGVEIGPFYRLSLYDPYGGRTYYSYLALVQWLLGPAPYGIVLTSVCAFVFGAVLMYRVVRAEFGPAVALGGLVAVLFWPTWFAWSVSMLKESLQFLLAALVAWGVVRLSKHGAGAVLALVVMAAAIAVTITLRAGVVAIPIAGALLGMFGALTARRPAAAIALVGALVVFAAMGVSRPSAMARVASEVRMAVGRHVGHVRSVGNAYKIADQRFYSDWPESWTTTHRDEGIRFLIRSAVAFILVPLPWQAGSFAGLAILPQQFAWYGLVALAFPGVWFGLRHAPQLTMALAGCCVAGLIVIAPNSGNIGTLIRHRDMIVPFLTWLGAAGAARIVRG